MLHVCSRWRSGCKRMNALTFSSASVQADMLAANSNHAADQTSKLHDMHSKLETMVEQHLVPMIDEEVSLAPNGESFHAHL